MESTGLLPSFGPERNEASWQQYVAAVSACSSFVGTNETFACLRAASTADLEQAIITTRINFANTSFGPVIDGPGGIVPARPSQIKPQGSLPTLFGSNLDEGALFTPQTIDSATEIEDSLIALVSPPVVSPETLAATIARVLELYPDVPALGSPFGTGNATFGLNSAYKRQAAICEYISPPCTVSPKFWFNNAPCSWRFHFPFVAAQPQPADILAGPPGIRVPLHRPRRGCLR